MTKNVGFPGVNEVVMLPRVVKKLQSAIAVPLQLDSSNPDALEAGLRVYNGKAAVNSVNGEPEVLERVLPIVKKYGASVVGLTLDKNGIPKTAEERVAIARRILQAALDHGIPREDVWIDCLTLTVSAQQEQAAETLKAVRTIREELPTKDGTGFRFEPLTDDPAVRKAVDDMVYDLYGEENPRPLADYIARHGQEMGGQQM